MADFKRTLDSADSSRADEVRTALDRLLGSGDLRLPDRRARLLRYLVEHSLAGDSERISEYAIGVDVLDKDADFDPKTDAGVRAEISRLRQNLREYYAAAGSQDEIRIDLPPRGYFPVFAVGAPPEQPRIVEPSASGPPRVRRRAIAAAVVVVLISTAGFVFWRFRTTANRRVTSLVVLPFEDQSPDHQSQYLADGLTDEVTNDLANLNGIRVIARTTAFAFRNRGIDIRQVGRQLGVDAALEGSIVRVGDRLHIRAQFNGTRDGYHLWSHTYDVHFRDLIEVQRDIARSIAGDLQSSRGEPAATAASVASPPPDREAHDLYLRGIAAANSGTPGGFLKAINLMQSAIAKDPKYAAPWFFSAKLRESMGYLNGWTAPMAEEVRANLNRALMLDPHLTAVHADLGFLAWEYDYDWPKAEREFQLALEQGNRVEAHKYYGMGLADRGRFTESHQHLRLAEDLAPLDTELLFLEGGVFAYERRYPEAERKYQAILKINPSQMPALAALAYIKTWENDCAGAASYLDRMQHLDPNVYRTISVHFAVLVCRGETGKARDLANSVRANGLGSAIEAAEGYAYLGDKDEALKYLATAVERHDFGATSIKQMQYLSNLHGDPRFIALERRVGLDP